MDQGGEYYKRYLHGDQDAFVSLVQMYMDGLVLFLTGITGDVTLAEDATEDTFVKLGVKRPHYSGKASFKTWLYAIGRNTARDHLRRCRRTLPLSPTVTDPLSEGLDPESHYFRKERDRRLHHAMGNLIPSHRQILWLIYFEGFSGKECAKIMGKTVHGIESLAYRARLALRQELQKEGIGDENLF